MVKNEINWFIDWTNIPLWIIIVIVRSTFLSNRKLIAEHQLIDERCVTWEGFSGDVRWSFKLGCQRDERKVTDELLRRVLMGMRGLGWCGAECSMVWILVEVGFESDVAINVLWISRTFFTLWWEKSERVFVAYQHRRRLWGSQGALPQINKNRLMPISVYHILSPQNLGLLPQCFWQVYASAYQLPQDGRDHKVNEHRWTIEMGGCE